MEPLAQEIFKELELIPTVDAHEHLPPEESRTAKPVDCFDLFAHYCVGDLTAAGAVPEDFAFWNDKSKTIPERWKRFKPFFTAIRTGGYARAALIVIRDLLEFDDLNDKTCENISKKLQEQNRPGLYNRILREKCNLAACIQCWQLGNSDPSYFYRLAPGPELVDILSQAKIGELSKEYNVSIHGVDGILECLTRAVQNWRRDKTVVGIKSNHAYSRSIRFEKVSRNKADEVFASILSNEARSISLHEAIPLQDYLMFELVARAEACGLPMVFHTGLQAGNCNQINNANPLLLQTLLEEFPKVKFDLFHAGMPWFREIAVLAKYFPNVYLNMAWTHIINPCQARCALSEWLDMVPNTKIFGFGGDYRIVEKVYGHLKLARQNIACVLAEKVNEGSYSRAEASMVAKRLVLDNPREFYGLPIDQA